VFFQKTPSQTIVGHGAKINLPLTSTAIDWEAELAVVIGTKGKNIPAERALLHAAAYCVSNDITARGYHRREIAPADAFSYDWFAAKSAEGSLPLGPGLTPAFMVPDPQDLRLRLWVNGDLQQDESTADMVCTVAELIAAASEVVTLEPGDVIATGTPVGIGAVRQPFPEGLLNVGDVMRVQIAGIGELVNTVVAEPEGYLAPESEPETAWVP
jgi:2-keto-4-pentenoate hydratase/2-oxohepta-3-ene-1,7-dioic acid hydratase in catechol pathway